MKTTPMNEKLYSYVMEHNFSIHPVLKKVSEFTSKRADKNMEISEDQGVFLYQCIRMMNPKRVFELGTFTGHSAISMALGLSAGAKLFSIDIDPEMQAVAKNFLQETAKDKNVEFLCGNGSEKLEELLNTYGESSFDFCFIDADKENYDHYYEMALKLIRPGGFIAADNVIWDGRVINSPEDHASTKSLVRFNEKVKTDKRVEAGMLHIADGIYMIRKK